MSLHINKFIDLVRATEARGQRDLHMSLRDAQDLHADITRLLNTLEELRQPDTRAQQQITEIHLVGGSFKTT